MTIDADAVSMTGALCIHPDQVAVISRAWRPVAALDGRMIDLPVLERARRLRTDN